MNDQDIKSKNKGWIGRYIKILVVILLVLSVSGYYIYSNSEKLGLSKPTLVIKVATGLADTGTPIITNATFEQSIVAFFYKTTDSPATFPEIDANARLNRLESVPATYWASTPYKGKDTYTLNMFFRNGYIPKKGDVLIISLRILSDKGTVAYKTTAFWVWE